MRANFQNNYLMRYAVLSGVCLFLGLWFAYDGFIGYPKNLVVAEKYEELADLPDRESEERWQQITQEMGWSSEHPKKSADEIRSDILGQYFWAALNFVVAVPALILLIRARGSWVESTATGLTTSWGQSMDYANVQQLSKHRWAKKGIAKATYTDAGQTKVFVFDDFKFEREPLDKMVLELESHLKPEQIVGGPPESELTGLTDS
ncbi:hypothetical protein [Aureliella helgolandensis]|uniref:Uncharacterized protein n=1 Tax=Aureliella helgolandensis TaxID=2527968 RepID=A0A518G605_9BACT|nr:hypothetical protein [Aureliella helgolandensis]QDV24018.1 hypothetical protein Q31a_23310 [Aureliella helgolandensis]